MSFSAPSRALPRVDARCPFGAPLLDRRRKPGLPRTSHGPRGPLGSLARARVRAKNAKASVRNSLAGEVSVAVLVPSSLRPPAGRIDF